MVYLSYVLLFNKLALLCFINFYVTFPFIIYENFLNSVLYKIPCT